MINRPVHVACACLLLITGFMLIILASDTGFSNLRVSLPSFVALGFQHVDKSHNASMFSHHDDNKGMSRQGLYAASQIRTLMDTSIDTLTTNPTRKEVNPGCRLVGFHHGKPLPLIALVSIEATGSTWVRHNIEQLTGKYLGQAYTSEWVSICATH